MPVLGRMQLWRATATASLQINVTVNGTARELSVDTRSSLLDVLRERLALTGARRAAITASAAPARCTSMGGGSRPA